MALRGSVPGSTGSGPYKSAGYLCQREKPSAWTHDRASGANLHSWRRQWRQYPLGTTRIGGRMDRPHDPPLWTSRQSRFCIGDSRREDGRVSVHRQLRAAVHEHRNYPRSHYLYLYVNCMPEKPCDSLVNDYARLALSSEGQAILASEKNSPRGYEPLSTKEVAEQVMRIR